MSEEDSESNFDRVNGVANIEVKRLKSRGGTSSRVPGYSTRLR